MNKMGVYDRLYSEIIKKIDPDNQHPAYSKVLARLIAKKILYGVIYSPETENLIAGILSQPVHENN